MENWGLMTFRENLLLFDPKSGSAGDKQFVAIVVAHELAHQVTSPTKKKLPNCIHSKQRFSTHLVVW
jgi:predicted SprT family Zn-dependent metalloprotease